MTDHDLFPIAIRRINRSEPCGKPASGRSRLEAFLAEVVGNAVVGREIGRIDRQQDIEINAIEAGTSVAYGDSIAVSIDADQFEVFIEHEVTIGGAD